MRFITLLFASILSLSTFSTMAGSGHDHGHDHSHSHTPVNQEQIGLNAAEIVKALVKRSKLDTSWKSIEATSIEKITVQGNPEWVVVYVNKNITDATKQKLYVFLTLGGDYIAANFTGK